MSETSPYRVLRSHDFRRLLLGSGLLTVAREAQIVVVGWQIFQLTDDPLSLGLIGLAEALPFIGLALFAGHLADRLERRRIVIAGTAALAVSALVLLALTLTGTIHAGRVWPVYLVVSASALARSFMRPAMYALSADVVPRDLFPTAVAWRTSSFHIAAVAGPAVGGLLYGFSGPALAYGIVVGVMTLSLLALAGIRHRQLPANATAEVQLMESVRGGLSFVWGEPVLLPAMTLDLFAVLFGGAVALLPAFAKLLGAGPEGLGLLRAAPAMGSIAMGLWLAHRPPLRNAGPVVLGCVAAFGACMIGFALSRSFWLSFALLVVSGLVDNVSVVVRSTLVQTRTPPHLLGRVAAINQIFIGSSNEIGAFESGVAARLLGLVPSVVFGGTMTLLVVVFVAWRWPALWRLRELRET